MALSTSKYSLIGGRIEDWVYQIDDM